MLIESDWVVCLACEEVAELSAHEGVPTECPRCGQEGSVRRCIDYFGTLRANHWFETHGFNEPGSSERFLRAEVSVQLLKGEGADFLYDGCWGPVFITP